MKKIKNYPLLSHNTFGMDVKAAVFIEYDSVTELKSLIAGKKELNRPWLHIGGGSNLLFRGDYAGTVLHSAIRGYEVIDEDESGVTVRVGAGEVWDDFVAYAVNHQWYGAENLSLIPGEVGASAVQNIGAYGVEAKDLIVRVETVEVETGKEHVFDKEECRYAYRESIFKNELKGRYIVTYVTYQLGKLPVFNLEYGNVRSELASRNCDVTLKNVRDTIIAVRKAKLPDPTVQGNAGSFFMNPLVSRDCYEALLRIYPDIPHYEGDSGRVKIPAAWMIDRCGWKGRQIGRAGVHSRQALVLVNCGGATGDEVISLAGQIQDSVFQKFGIRLSPEVNFI